MNHKRTLALFVTMGILLLAVGQSTGQESGPQNPQGTYGYAFTYQGQLRDTSGPVNGSCDLRFSLRDAPSGGSQVGNTVTLEAIELQDGLFTARLDFGGGVHSGAARWLEIGVRCPAGSGGYATLSPRQELTAAPAALTLALPFTARANIGGPVVAFHNTGDGEAALFSSALGYALWVESAGLDGVRIASAGQDGVNVISAGGSGLAVEMAGGDGVFVNTAHGNGVKVNSADFNGVQVDAAGGDGVSVGSAGGIGVYVVSAGGPGVYVGSAGGDGFSVPGASGAGLYVGTVGDDGVQVHRAGSPSWVQWSGQRKNGFEVAGAQGHGLYVGRADNTGVFVHSAGWNGMVVEAAGGDGVRATATTYNALYGDTSNAQGEWGLYTPDKVRAQSVTLQTLTLIAQVSGPTALSSGDVVAAAGVGASLPGASAPLPLVRLAGSDASGVVGVVEGRLALTLVLQPEGEEAEERLELRSAEGPARPGDTVALTVLGLARVRVDAGQGAIQAGTRLTGGAGGRARALKTVVVEGMTLAESAPVLGIALAQSDEDGLVWVLVNPQ